MNKEKIFLICVLFLQATHFSIAEPLVLSSTKDRFELQLKLEQYDGEKNATMSVSFNGTVTKLEPGASGRQDFLLEIREFNVHSLRLEKFKGTPFTKDDLMLSPLASPLKIRFTHNEGTFSVSESEELKKFPYLKSVVFVEAIHAMILTATADLEFSKSKGGRIFFPKNDIFPKGWRSAIAPAFAFMPLLDEKIRLYRAAEGWTDAPFITSSYYSFDDDMMQKTKVFVSADSKIIKRLEADIATGFTGDKGTKNFNEEVLKPENFKQRFSYSIECK
jgi:hypothetical protein